MSNPVYTESQLTAARRYAAEPFRLLAKDYEGEPIAAMYRDTAAAIEAGEKDHVFATAQRMEFFLHGVTRPLLDVSDGGLTQLYTQAARATRPGQTIPLPESGTTAQQYVARRALLLSGVAARRLVPNGNGGFSEILVKVG